MAWRVWELQAFSCQVWFHGDNMILSYLPEFVTKTQSSSSPILQSFIITFLSSFVEDQSLERFLCPVQALRCYLYFTEQLDL